MIISGIAKSSLVDYPGLVSCVLFVAGCNFNCFYCHNRSLLDGSHDTIGEAYLWDFLSSRVSKLDGVVISGGEPTLQNDLVQFIQKIKKLGFNIKLDTNGSSPRVVQKLLLSDACDYYAVDYKAPLKRYEEICGKNADAQNVLQTIKLLLSHHAAFEVRTTVIPQLAADDLLAMAKELPLIPRYVLNRYRKPDYYLPSDQARIQETPYMQAQILHFADLIRGYQPNIIV
ncbi:MAG: anaerobic ribonucleoside-triphosphate reductase activating protein [Christensenellales bacterium]